MATPAHTIIDCFKGAGSAWQGASVKNARMVVECGSTKIGPRVLLTVRDEEGHDGAVVALTPPDALYLADALKAAVKETT